MNFDWVFEVSLYCRQYCRCYSIGKVEGQFNFIRDKLCFLLYYLCVIFKKFIKVCRVVILIIQIRFQKENFEESKFNGRLEKWFFCFKISNVDFFYFIQKFVKEIFVNKIECQNVKFFVLTVYYRLCGIDYVVDLVFIVFQFVIFECQYLGFFNFQ